MLLHGDVRSRDARGDNHCLDLDARPRPRDHARARPCVRVRVPPGTSSRGSYTNAAHPLDSRLRIRAEDGAVSDFTSSPWPGSLVRAALAGVTASDRRAMHGSETRASP
jgi:hypothetical protein